ncbi:MAG: hypothetical protein HN472_12775 [Nitrospina sp.]|jgi:PBP1b-binding outer membrane lipoprotein LpoB|nr:hypothetical protein [Nitrospina sp.]MBT3875835.1 hypothetical protein [Nitrospina sp.]MBT4049282.1 hypothetical protein [Nitrospina sp.]MBT4557250.1 hypothetical protein [Nitrospina sp.]MBT5347521.1 hypothetical protein [Nitrospina sp.]
MKTGITLIFLITLLVGCSEDSTDKKAPKPEANSPTSSVKTEPAKTTLPTVPYPNSPTDQDLQPDLHVSGVQSNHASGAMFSSEHLSGQ